jgi:hypothetical protein
VPHAPPAKAKRAAAIALSAVNPKNLLLTIGAAAGRITQRKPVDSAAR